MPTFPIDSILGIRDLIVQRVERGRDIHVWARTAVRASCVYCQRKAVRIKATYQRTLKHTRQGNQLLGLHLKVPKYHCLDCNRYFRHRFADIRPRLRATEAYRLEVFEAHDDGISQCNLTLTQRIGSATVYEALARPRCTGQKESWADQSDAPSPLATE